MHEQVYHHDDKAANHQLPIALTFWIIQIVSVEECSSLTQNLMQICYSTCSVILNATATQYTCSLNGVYRPHWLVQWSHHCSRMCIPVHSPWLPGYINVSKTVRLIVTMAGLFPDRPCTYTQRKSVHFLHDQTKDWWVNQTVKQRVIKIDPNIYKYFGLT